MTGAEIRQAVRGRWLSRNEPLPVRGVSIDSRTAQADDLFIAIPGEHHDGHDYLAAAVSAGCIAAVIDLKKQPAAQLAEQFPAGVIGVADTRAALLELATYYRSVIPATVIGVTGSNGKTTVKRMIDHILSKRLTGTASPKSFNNDIGVPLTLLSAGAGDDYLICEVGSSGPGEIATLARAVKPNISVITSIGPSHLERLESVDRVAVEKAALLGWLGDRDVAVVTADSHQLDHALKSYQHGRIIRFGESAEAQLRLTGYESDGQGQRFQINDRDWATLQIPGRHNAYNALAAFAVVARFGFSQEEAIEALADFPGVQMRLQWMTAGSIRILNDAYNANPASVPAAVDVLSDCQAKRKILIIGDMLELGEQAETLHAQVGRSIAGRRLDLVIGVGKLGSIIAETTAQAGKTIETFDNLDVLHQALGGLLRSGDAVLLKASRGVGLERLIAPIEAIGGKSARSRSMEKKA
jgi:UDP-N-acetylmuramoyl-tripeptide--D-alanyl-D-alanine ligase